MYDTLKAAPAEHILNIANQQDVFGLMSDLARSRELSFVVKSLNAAVLDGQKDTREQAIAALTRMGMWLD